MLFFIEHCVGLPLDQHGTRLRSPRHTLQLSLPVTPPHFPLAATAVVWQVVAASNCAGCIATALRETMRNFALALGSAGEVLAIHASGNGVRGNGRRAAMQTGCRAPMRLFRCCDTDIHVTTIYIIQHAINPADWPLSTQPKYP